MFDTAKSGTVCSRDPQIGMTPGLSRALDDRADNGRDGSKPVRRNEFRFPLSI
jgi:hypothetical protein